MTTRTWAGTLIVSLFVIQGPALFAQKGTLPNGRPFQILADSVADIDAAVQAQIADLQAQLDANAANDAIRDQLIGALQSAVNSLEMRMAGAEASIEELDQYNALQDALLQQQISRINSLQNQVNSQNSAINQLFGLNSQQQSSINQLFSLNSQQQLEINSLSSQNSLQQSQINQLFSTTSGQQFALNQISQALNALFALHNAQQSAISNLQGQIFFLSSQVNSQASQIFNLQSQLNNLNFQYLTTRNALAFGCPLNSSIRQVHPSGGVSCEPDNPGTVNAFQFSANIALSPLSTASGSVFCPPSSSGAVWFATGGGFSFGANVQVNVSARSNNGWFVVAKNSNPVAVGGLVLVTCTVQPQ